MSWVEPALVAICAVLCSTFPDTTASNEFPAGIPTSIIEHCVMHFD